MLGPTLMLSVFGRLQAAGVRPPEVLSEVGRLRATAQDYARILGARGVTAQELGQAVDAYLESDDPADRWWPTPGALLARTASHRLAVAAQGPDAAARAWQDMLLRLRVLHRDNRPRRDSPVHQFTDDRWLNEAAWAGWQAAGGPCIYDMALEAVDRVYRRAWIDAWRATRAAQMQGPERRTALGIAGPARQVTGPGQPGPADE